MMRLLVTGGMGFIGSNFIRYMLEKHGNAIAIDNLDALTYAGNPANLADLQSRSNYHFTHGDINDPEIVEAVMSRKPDAIVHFAAESHVDRSIADPAVFLRTNVLGTQTLLEAARKSDIALFIHVSTDEVYGSLGSKGYFSEHKALAPNSPYSASKAASDFIARAYYHTYGLPVIITRCSNNYGPRQYPEKLIPSIITKVLGNQPVPIYGDGLNVRDWLHVEDHCAAIDGLLTKGVPGEVYNIGGNNERTNIEIARLILRELGKPESIIQFVKDRPGHDRRYAINARKIRSEIGWKPAYRFEAGIRDTIKWYIDHEAWWKPLLKQESLKGEVL